MPNRGRRGARRGRGRGRGRGRRQLVRLAHSIENVELHGGSLPRPIASAPPPIPAGRNAYGITLRSVVWITCAPKTVVDTWFGIGKETFDSIKDPNAALLALFSYYRVKYADIWFMPIHGVSTTGIYVMHTMTSELAGSWNHPNPETFEIEARATDTSTCRAYQTARHRFHFFSERSTCYRRMPAYSASSTGDDLFHVDITVPNEGIIDPNGTANEPKLKGRLVVDLHLTLKGSRFSPMSQVLGQPSFHSDGYISFGIAHVATIPHHFDTLISTIQNEYPHCDLSDLKLGSMPKTDFIAQVSSAIADTVVPAPKSRWGDVLRILRQIYGALVPPPGNPGTSEDDGATSPLGSDISMI